MKRITMITALLIAPVLAFAHFGDYEGGGWGGHMGQFGWGGGGFMMIFFLALIIFGIFFFVREFTGRRSGNSDSAIQILKERFAQGEITQTEYLEMKKQVTK